MGMFSHALIAWLQCGQAERGTTRLYGVCRAASLSGCDIPLSSAHCCFQPSSIIFGNRWITTLRKLPTIRPSTPHMMVNASGEDWRSWNNAVMSAVSVETNPLAGYVGTKTADHQAQYAAHDGERER